MHPALIVGLVVVGLFLLACSLGKLLKRRRLQQESGEERVKDFSDDGDPPGTPHDELLHI